MKGSLKLVHPTFVFMEIFAGTEHKLTNNPLSGMFFFCLRGPMAVRHGCVSFLSLQLQGTPAPRLGVWVLAVEAASGARLEVLRMVAQLCFSPQSESACLGLALNFQQHAARYRT